MKRAPGRFRKQPNQDPLADRVTVMELGLRKLLEKFGLAWDDYVLDSKMVGTSIETVANTKIEKNNLVEAPKSDPKKSA